MRPSFEKYGVDVAINFRLGTIVLSFEIEFYNTLPPIYCAKTNDRVGDGGHLSFEKTSKIIRLWGY